MSRYAIFGFGIFSGVLSVVLEAIGLSLGFVYLMMGIFVGSAVMPIAFVLTWDKATAQGAIPAPLPARSSPSSPGSPSRPPRGPLRR